MLKVLRITKNEFNTCLCCGRRIKTAAVIAEYDGEKIVTHGTPFGLNCAAKLLGMAYPESKKTQDALIKNHEKELNSERKTCENCHGTGKVNGRYVSYRDTWVMKEEQVLTYDNCKVCNGKGFFEKKWV